MCPGNKNGIAQLNRWQQKHSITIIDFQIGMYEEVGDGGYPAIFYILWKKTRVVA